ncbi:unnamed protein product [Heligmosomoides polygyrus]|uniref:CCHC-type domain-containing protein n=1 Tax=Heligmosomoides polygyrus TaxID=6339 RepID=A0A3P7XP36_HELPZ|nr:unnamed protein product [Heligmosomoides polygyrus]
MNLSLQAQACQPPLGTPLAQGASSRPVGDQFNQQQPQIAFQESNSASEQLSQPLGIEPINAGFDPSNSIVELNQVDANQAFTPYPGYVPPPPPPPSDVFTVQGTETLVSPPGKGPVLSPLLDTGNSIVPTSNSDQVPSCPVELRFLSDFTACVESLPFVPSNEVSTTCDFEDTSYCRFQPTSSLFQRGKLPLPSHYATLAEVSGRTMASQPEGSFVYALILQTYKNPQGKDFSDFVLKFRIKYGSLGLRDDMLSYLLLSKMDGYPKAVAQALPKHVRESSFEDLLKRLRKTGDITTYCVELERLTRSAYPDQSEEDLSRTRAGELVSQLTNWPEYLQLYTAMEIAPKELAYEMVKAMAQRCERSKRMADAMREQVEMPEVKRSEGGRGGDHAKALDRSGGDRGDTPVGSTDTQRAQTQIPGQRKCINCNRFGHLRKDCLQQRAVRAMDKPTESAEPQREPKIFTASLSKWRCGVTKVNGLHEDLVGAQTTAQVQLLGMTRTALLDTGSQVSIIPLQMLVNALQNGKAVYDASGNPTSFKGAAKLTVEVDKGPRHRIGLSVMAGGDDVIVLGTNALKKLGWSLAPNAQSSRGRAEVSRGRRHQRQQAEVKEAAVQQRRTKASEVIAVARRICLKPGETKVVSPHRDEMKQGEVVRSSGEILPDTKGQSAQHQFLIPKTNSFAGAKMFREGEVVNGDEVDCVEEVRAELTSYLSALKRRLEGVVCRHYVEVVGKHKVTKSRGKEERPGRNERRMRTPVVTARISCSFEAASKELKKRRRQNKAARARRRRGEYRPSLSVMPDQERPRREITLERQVERLYVVTGCFVAIKTLAPGGTRTRIFCFPGSDVRLTPPALFLI